MDPSNPYGEIPITGNDNKQHKGRHFLKIGIIVTILVAAAVLIAILFTEAAKREAERAALDGSTRIDRDGYTQVAESIGDPAALTQRETTIPVNYNGSAVIDACHLLPLDTIRDQSLFVTPSTAPDAISRYYFDGSTVELDPFFLESELIVRDVNSCSFSLADEERRQGGIRVEVFQPGYSNDEALRRVLDDYLIQGDIISGVQKYDRVRNTIVDGGVAHYLQKDQTYVGVEFNLGKDKQDTVDALLERVAERLATVASSPRGPIGFGVESPTFDATFTSACAISEAVDVVRVFEQTASPIVQERLATATAIVGENDNRSNSINHQCIRRVSGDPQEAPSLTIDVTSYENDAAAETAVKALRNDGSLPTPAPVGDDSFFTVTGSAENRFVFRSEKTVVAFWIYDPQPGDEQLTNDEQLAALAPVGQNLLARLQGKPIPVPDPTDKDEEPATPPRDDVTET